MPTNIRHNVKHLDLWLELGGDDNNNTRPPEGARGRWSELPPLVGDNLYMCVWVAGGGRLHVGGDDTLPHP